MLEKKETKIYSKYTRLTDIDNNHDFEMNINSTIKY